MPGDLDTVIVRFFLGICRVFEGDNMAGLKTYPFQAKNKKIEVDFLALRKSITEMRSDSILVK